MGDSAFSLPTLMIIVPAAGGLIAMSMLTRRAAAVTSLVTVLVQTMLLVLGAIQLDRFADAARAGAAPSCEQSAASEGANLVLAQCTDWFPQWGIQYHVALGWAALGLVALTTLVTACATAFTWWADRDRPAPMHGLMWICAASLTGLFLARDLVLFYVFFELMLVPLLILVGRWGGEQRVRATMSMFVYTLVGSLPMLVGIVGVGVAANAAIAKAGSGLADASTFSLPLLAELVASDRLDLSAWILASFLLAFAIKAPLLPFHGWLPLAYREAPVEVTAMLSGLVSKAAFFGMFVIVLPLFPAELAGGWGTALTWLALISLIYGSFAAFRQPDARGVVAYSSLAQMGLIVLGLAAFTGEGGMQGVGGAYLQTINHGLISAGLFLLVGIIEHRTGEREFAKLGGLAHGRARLASLGLVLTLIALAVPGASTFAGELLILGGVFRGDVSGPLVATIGATAVVLAAMYALRLLAGLAFSSDDETTAAAAPANARFGSDLGARELLIIGPAIVALLVLSAWPNLARRAMSQPPVAIEMAADPVAKLQAAAKDDHAGSGHAEHGSSKERRMIQTPALHWIAIAPEIATAVGAMLVLLVGLGHGPRNRAITVGLTLFTLAVAIGLSLFEFSNSRYGEFAGQVTSDEVANVGRILAACAAACAVVFGARGRASDGRHGEFHALILAAVCGMGLMAASSSFVTLFVGLELFSIALYVLCALDADRAASLESGLKYLIIGGMSSAVLLYGTALVYGATGSFNFAAIGTFDGNRGMLLYAGAAMVLGGLAFKVSAAPMHWWTPDVYEGAGTPVTAFMSVATKVVAFLVLGRVLIVAFGPEADRWIPIVAALAVASIVIGNLGALVQQHLKRMLAYSSIAQAGYLLLGIVGYDRSGFPALVYALVVYSAMTLGAFAYVMLIEREIGRDATFADLAGRGWASHDASIVQALPALGMSICMLSLAGIPPMAGFFSKFGLFQAVVESDYAWLAVVAAVGSIISLGYYLRVVVELYMRQPDTARIEAAAASLPAPCTAHAQPAGIRMPVVAALGFALALATLLLAFVPAQVFDAACDARSELVTGSGSCTEATQVAAARSGSAASTAAAPSPG